MSEEQELIFLENSITNGFQALKAQWLDNNITNFLEENTFRVFEIVNK